MTLRNRTTTLALAALTALAFTLAALPTALATSGGDTPHHVSDGNHGTVKIHDEASAQPPSKNQPHVDCDFWVEGFNMKGSAGTLRFYAWPPTGDKELVLTASWTGTHEGDGKGYHFNVGPLMLPSGHYRLETFADVDHPGYDDHFAKAKMFWVECQGPEPSPSPSSPPPSSPPATSPPPVCADNDQPSVTSYHYVVANVTYAHLPPGLPAGITASVIFTLGGCNERMLSFVSYEATSDFNLPDQTVYDAETGTFGAGTHAMDIAVPPCYYQIDFVYGAVIAHFNPDAGVTYHGEGRFIDGVQGSNETCAPPPVAPPCPTDLVASANNGGSVTLTFTATGADNLTVLRASGGGDFEVLAVLAGDATSYTDTMTSVGTSYSYRVVATAGGLTSEGCEAVTVTAVPVFPGAMAIGLALAGVAAAGLIVLRRRS